MHTGSGYHGLKAAVERQFSLELSLQRESVKRMVL
jgi:hypothetical protein